MNSRTMPKGIEAPGLEKNSNLLWHIGKTIYHTSPDLSAGIFRKTGRLDHRILACSNERIHKRRVVRMWVICRRRDRLRNTLLETWRWLRKAWDG